MEISLLESEIAQAVLPITAGGNNISRHLSPARRKLLGFQTDRLDGFVKGRFVDGYKEKITFEEASETKKDLKQKQRKKVVKKKRIVFGMRREGNIQETVEALLDNDIERSKIGNVIKDPGTASKIRVLLAKNYLRLENLFRHLRGH